MDETQTVVISRDGLSNVLQALNPSAVSQPVLRSVAARHAHGYLDGLLYLSAIEDLLLQAGMVVSDWRTLEGQIRQRFFSGGSVYAMR